MRTSLITPVIILWGSVLSVDARIWTDSTGQYKTEAEFLDCNNGIVRLKKPDGRIVSVAIEKLSEPDQQFIESRLHGPTRGPDVDKFLKTLRAECLSRREDISAAIREAKQKQARQLAAAKPDKELSARAKAMAAAVRRAVVSMRQTVDLKGVHLLQQDGFTLNMWIDRDDAMQALANSEKLLRARKQISRKLRLRHQNELKEYAAAQRLAATSEALVHKATKAIEAVANKPDLVKVQMTKWEKAVRDSIEQTDKALTAARDGEHPRGQGKRFEPDPIGYYYSGRSQLTVVVSCRSELFIPSEIEHYIILAGPNSMGTFLPFSRDEIRAYKPDRFGLILDDGSKYRARRILDWNKLSLGENSPELGVTASKGPRPAVVTLAVCWDLAVNDLKPPFKLQLDYGRPVSVPDKRLNPPPDRAPRR